MNTGITVTLGHSMAMAINVIIYSSWNYTLWTFMITKDEVSGIMAIQDQTTKLPLTLSKKPLTI